MNNDRVTKLMAKAAQRTAAVGGAVTEYLNNFKAVERLVSSEMISIDSTVQELVRTVEELTEQLTMAKETEELALKHQEELVEEVRKKDSEIKGLVEGIATLDSEKDAFLKENARLQSEIDNIEEHQELTKCEGEIPAEERVEIVGYLQEIVDSMLPYLEHYGEVSFAASGWQEKLKNLIGSINTRLHKSFPNLTPEQVSFMGTDTVTHWDEKVKAMVQTKGSFKLFMEHYRDLLSYYMGEFITDKQEEKLRKLFISQGKLYVSVGDRSVGITALGYQEGM